MTRVDPRLLQINRDGVLSIPASLWWCVVLMLRHSLLLVVALVSAMAGGGSQAWVFALVAWPALLCEAPMWPFVLSAARRSPQAGSLVRWLWRQGRLLLTLAATLQIGWTVWGLSQREIWSPWPERFMAMVALIELTIIAGIWRSDLYRQLFQEFPARPDAPPVGPTAVLPARRAPPP